MQRLTAVLAPLALGATLAAATPTRDDAAKARAPRRAARSAALTVVPASQRFGINAQVLFWRMPPSVWPEHVREMRQDGIKVVRTDAFWDSTEPQPPVGGVHRYRWDRLDAIVGTLASAGLRWLPVLDYSTPWAASRRNAAGQPLLYSPPASDAAFASYAQAVARRYGPGGDFWRAQRSLTAEPVTAIEIWNEENGPVFWYPAADASAYSRLYEAARAAVHRVDRSTEVLVGGLTNPSAPFLASMYAALGGRSGQIDAVAIHPYAPTPARMLPDLVETRQVLDQHGDIDVPIDVTEFGWATHGAPSAGQVANEQQRASYLQQFTQTAALSDCGIERILPHTWATLDRDYSNPEDWYGLVQPNAAPTPSAVAYATTVGELTRAPATGAAYPTCNRALTVTGAPVRPAAQLGSRARHRRRHRRRPRRARALRSVCARASVLSSATAVDAATVTFVLKPSGAGAPPHAGPLSVQRISDQRGSAQACWRSATRRAGAVTITASRADFARTATATVALS